jgi:hypothetical protein
MTSRYEISMKGRRFLGLGLFHVQSERCKINSTLEYRYTNFLQMQEHHQDSKCLRVTWSKFHTVDPKIFGARTVHLWAWSSSWRQQDSSKGREPLTQRHTATTCNTRSFSITALRASDSTDHMHFAVRQIHNSNRVIWNQASVTSYVHSGAFEFKTETTGKLTSLQVRNRWVITNQFYFTKSTPFVHVLGNPPTWLMTYRKTSTMNEG